MKTRPLIAVSLLAAALAGCASTENYVDDVNQIQDQVIEASNSIGSDINASKQEIVDSLEAAQAEAEDAVSGLQDIEVPEDAEKGHAKLVAGFADLEKLYADVKKQVENQTGGDAFAELRSQGAKIDKEIDSALDQINDELGLE